TSFYEFLQFTNSQEVISVIADTPTAIIDCTGPSNTKVITVKDPNAGAAFFQSVGNTLYFGDGVDTSKYIPVSGNYVIQNWGISLSTTNSSVQENASSGQDVPVVVPDEPPNGDLWNNPNNVTIGASYASMSLTNLGYSDTLLANFPTFSLPVANDITGIQVTFNYYITGTNTFNASSISPLNTQVAL